MLLLSAHVSYWLSEKLLRVAVWCWKRRWAQLAEARRATLAPLAVVEEYDCDVSHLN